MQNCINQKLMPSGETQWSSLLNFFDFDFFWAHASKEKEKELQLCLKEKTYDAKRRDDKEQHI